MEILNNIWLALSIPNDLFIKILSILFPFFLEVPLLLYLFCTALNITSTKKQKIIYVILISIASLITNNLLPIPFNIILNYLIIFIVVKIVFKLTVMKSIIATLLPVIVFSLVGTLIINPFITIFGITLNQTETIPIYRLLYLIPTYFLVFTITFLIKRNNITIEILEDLDKKNKRIIIMNLVVGILVIAFQNILTAYYTNQLPIIITFINFLSLLLYFSITLYSLTKVMKLVTTTRLLQSAEEYNKTLHILHDKVRGFKHDFDNIVTTIGGYVRTNDMEGLKNYYVQLEDDCQRVNNLYLLNPDVVNNPGIYNLLATKYHLAEEKDIKVTITFLLDLKQLHMKIYDFAKILGILLDNAIEASEQSEEKLINIIFRTDDKNHRQLVIIENSYANKQVDTELIFNKGISEKENHSGLGLWEIREILKKNNNLNLHTTKTNDLFMQELEIYY